MKSKPTHFVNDSGYFYSWINTYCGLGDGFDKGYENGTTIKSDVTCKKCLREISKQQ